MTDQRLLPFRDPRPSRRDRAEAKALGDRGAARAVAGADPWVLSVVYRAIGELAVRGDPFTAEDVWTRCPEIDGAAAYDGRLLGGCLRQAARLGTIRPLEHFRPSTRVACHGRPMRAWIGTSSSELTGSRAGVEERGVVLRSDIESGEGRVAGSTRSAQNHPEPLRAPGDLPSRDPLRGSTERVERSGGEANALA